MDAQQNSTPDAAIAPVIEAEAKRLYIELDTISKEHKQVARRQRLTGLQFGKAVFELRAGAETCAGGTTFNATLDRLGIPRRTAYRWIKKYELSIGVRPPVPEVAGIPVLGINCDASREEKKRAAKVYRIVQKMTCDISILGNGNCLKAQRIAEACEDRDQLDRLLCNLRDVHHRIEQAIPAIEAVLAATPTAEQKAKTWARVRAEISADSATVN